MNKGIVYILRSGKGVFYVGSTNDLRRRLGQHRNGHTATTSRMDDFELVLSQEYPTLGDARVVEKKIKGLKRKDYIEKMIKEGHIRISF